MKTKTFEFKDMYYTSDKTINKKTQEFIKTLKHPEKVVVTHLPMGENGLRVAITAPMD